MNQSPPSAIDYAELLLQEGKKREACALLAAYLKRNPASVQAWWSLSRAVETPAQERDCLERVLRLDPAHAQARARLDQLKAPPPSIAKPFTATLPKDRVPPEWTTAPDLEAEPEEQIPQPSWVSRPAPDLTPAAPKAEAPSPAATSAAQAAPGQQKSPAPAAESAMPRPEPSFVPAWAEPPAPPRAAGSQVQPPPRRKRFGVLDVVMILIILCLILAVLAFFGLQEVGRTVMQDVYATQTVAQALTGLPTATLEPSRTFTLSPSPMPTDTAPPPAETPTPSPTLLYTLTRTPIPANAIGLVTGKYPPDFTLTEAASGAQVSLGDYLGQQPVVLFFWAASCPSCEQEIAALQSVYEENQEDGLVVLAINQNDPLQEVLAFRAEHGMTFPILLDTGEVSQQYEVSAIPHHLFVSRSGRIVSVISRMLSASELKAQVMSIMRIFPTSTP